MENRIQRVRAILGGQEAALIASEANRLYLTGFHSSAGYVVVTPGRAVFMTDFRYIEKARSTVKHTEVEMMERAGEQIAAILKREGIRTLLVETESTSLSARARMAEQLAGVELPAADDRLDRALTDARAQKSESELAAICAAQKITDDTFSYILDRLTPGRTELEVALDMEFFLRRAGSDGVAFDFIVVSGKNSSLPHGTPTDKQLARGDFLTMDFGAVVNGYRSDMTRTVAIGEADGEQRQVYDTVLKAQLAAIDFLRAGVTGKEADRVARDIIREAGYGACFGHGLGHSVGVEIHESPACNTRCDTVLAPGTVMTVEPGIYLENRFGVRIEDMVYLTADGNINLTKSEKKLLIV